MIKSGRIKATLPPVAPPKDRPFRTGEITDPCKNNEHNACSLGGVVFNDCGCDCHNPLTKRNCILCRLVENPTINLASIELESVDIDGKKRPILAWCCGYCYATYCTRLNNGLVMISAAIDHGHYANHLFEDISIPF